MFIDTIFSNTKIIMAYKNPVAPDTVGDSERDI